MTGIPRLMPLLLALALIAAAGPADTAPEPPPEPAALVDAPDAAEPVSPLAQRLLLQAAEAIRRSDPKAALGHLDTLRGLLPPDHWLQEVAEALIATAMGLATPRPAAEGLEAAHAATPKVPDAADVEAVATLYTHLGLFGAWAGINLFALQAELDGQAAVPLSVLTAAGGVGVAYWLDNRSEPLTGGTAAAITMGLQFGSAYGLLILGGLNESGEDLDEQATGNLIFFSGLGGASLAGTIANLTGADRGDLGLIYSGGFWGGLLGPFTALAFDLDDDEPFWFGLGMSLTGLAIGTAMATQLDYTRAQSLFIDLGGLSGFSLGLGIIFLGDFADEQAGLALLVGTTFGGLATATVLTAMDVVERDSESRGGAAGASEDAVRLFVAPGMLSCTASGAPSAPGLVLGGYFR